MATGEWLSAPKGDLEQDTTLHVVEEDGRPSFFQQELTPSEQKVKKAQASVSGSFTQDTPGDEPSCQHSPHGSGTLVGDRTRKGSSTAETTQSDSSQDTVPQKCDAPMPEVYRPQKKGTRFLISPKFHLEVADRFKVKCSVESSERFRACDTYAFTLIACSRLLRTPNHQRLHAALNFNQEIQKSCPFPSHCIDAVKCNDRY